MSDLSSLEQDYLVLVGTGLRTLQFHACSHLSSYGVFGEQIFLFLQFRSEMKRKLEISFRITLLILVPNTL